MIPTEYLPGQTRDGFLCDLAACSLTRTFASEYYEGQIGLLGQAFLTTLSETDFIVSRHQLADSHVSPIRKLILYNALAIFI